jgi:hypothetical protein
LNDRNKSEIIAYEKAGKVMTDQTRDKLLIEYPFRQGLAIYFGIWKKLGLRVVEAIAAIALGMTLVYAVSAIGVSVVLGFVSTLFSTLASLLFGHPILTAVLIVVIVIAITARINRVGR